ncbi:MAG: hypothetical protein MMC33_001774 [Icmadophila ericetorum]|nr:hypothetical protein [Icmadophila ericetorum]
MDSVFQLVANVIVLKDLTLRGTSRLGNLVVKVVQKTRDTQDLRFASNPTQFTYQEPPSTLPFYIYDPIIHNSSIRLLILAPGQSNDPISCELYTVDLETSPEYEAISYCWGGPPDERKIACGNRTLSITKNLYDALQQIRDQKEPRILWTDAICINQMDLIERAKQVQLMGRIYEQCSRCIAWLGMDEIDDYFATHLLVKLSQLNSSQRSRVGRKPWSKLTTTQHQWDSLRKLLNRPWFIRIWTLQEIIIPRQAVIICGKYEWEADEFFKLIKFAYDNQGEEDLGGFTYGMLQCLKVATAREKRHKQVSASQNSLLGILRDARERHAGDERDKIFAILGLCKEEDSRKITPNYEDTPAKVYTNVAKTILMSTDEPLRLLSAAGLGEQSSVELTLPSWVPDWSCRTMLTPSIHQFEECGKFKAGSHLKPSMRFLLTEDTEHLHLRGILVTILHKFIDISETAFQDSWREKNYPVKSMRKKFADIYFATVFGLFFPEDKPRSLLQWFVIQCSRECGRKYVKESWNYNLLWQTMSREAGRHEAVEDQKKKFRDYAWPPDHSKEEGGKKLAPFLHDLGLWTQNRKFCKGADGGIGWVPLAATRGDIVCVFQGSELPYVVRRVVGGRGFHLVGHCYYSGIMHGEMRKVPRWGNIALM